MFEEIKFLEGLQSVNSEVKVIVSSHTERVSGVLDLDIIEDHSGDVVGVLLSHGFIWSGLNGGKEVGGVLCDSGGNLGAEESGVIVSGGLGV